MVVVSVGLVTPSRATTDSSSNSETSGQNYTETREVCTDFRAPSVSHLESGNDVVVLFWS